MNNANASAMLGRSKSHAVMDTGSHDRRLLAWTQVGTTHASGRQLNAEESAIMAHLVEGTALTPISAKAQRLMDAGVMLRPGFKYGCRWRAYDNEIDVAHAPWLVQTEDQRPDRGKSLPRRSTCRGRQQNLGDGGQRSMVGGSSCTSRSTCPASS